MEDVSLKRARPYDSDVEESPAKRTEADILAMFDELFQEYQEEFSTLEEEYFALEEESFAPQEESSAPQEESSTSERHTPRWLQKSRAERAAHVKKVRRDRLAVGRSGRGAQVP